MMKRRMTAVLMTAALVAASPASVLADSVTVEPEEKQYVIVAEDKEAYAAVSEEIGEGAMAEDPVLKENQVIAAVLTEAEAEALGEDGVLVEEDIILSGSTEETGGEVLTEERDGEEETVITEEEARQRKLAVKQKKQEALDRDGEEDGTDETEDGNEPEWNLKAVNAEGLAEEGEGKVRAKVAVLDSGVDYVTGINLEGYVNLVEGEEELSPIFQDLTGHGTGIAGIISGNGETGIHGVNPHAEVYSVKVLDGENKAPLSRIIKGIYWCIEAEMDIINMSFGTPVYSKALEQAVKDADAAGILMVGAAGNGGGAVEYPAAFPEVMAVVAADPEAEVSEFSNTKANRKYFLYGCAIHSITDAFAHSTTYLDGNRIKHDGNGKVGNADKIGHVPDRYAVAVYVTRHLLEELKYDIFSNGDQIISGIKKKYKSGNATFKMIRLKQYINQTNVMMQFLTN